jgi:hypothetical protein
MRREELEQDQRSVGFDERRAVGESDIEVLAMGGWMGYNERLAVRGGIGTTVLSAIWGLDESTGACSMARGQEC